MNKTPPSTGGKQSPAARLESTALAANLRVLRMMPAPPRVGRSRHASIVAVARLEMAPLPRRSGSYVQDGTAGLAGGAPEVVGRPGQDPRRSAIRALVSATGAVVAHVSTLTCEKNEKSDLDHHLWNTSSG